MANAPKATAAALVSGSSPAIDDPASPGATPADSITPEQMKTYADLLAKLKERRQELKNRLNKQDLSRSEETEYAAKLHTVSENIDELEKRLCLRLRFT